jgi:hypothetical protein
MSEASGEAVAAYAMAYRLAVHLAKDGGKQDTLNVLTDCMQDLLLMDRRDGAKLVLHVHTAIEKRFPEAQPGA